MEISTFPRIKNEVAKLSLSEEQHNLMIDILQKIKDIELAAYNQCKKEVDYDLYGKDEDCFVESEEDYQKKIDLRYEQLIKQLSCIIIKSQRHQTETKTRREG